MRYFSKFILVLVIVLFWNQHGIARDKTHDPVTKCASPEVRALLKLFYDISGEYLLAGHHNFPNVKERNTKFETTK